MSGLALSLRYAREDRPCGLMPRSLFSGKVSKKTPPRGARVLFCLCASLLICGGLAVLFSHFPFSVFAFVLLSLSKTLSRLYRALVRLSCLWGVSHTKGAPDALPYACSSGLAGCHGGKSTSYKKRAWGEKYRFCAYFCRAKSVPACLPAAGGGDVRGGNARTDI